MKSREAAVPRSRQGIERAFDFAHAGDALGSNYPRNTPRAGEEDAVGRRSAKVSSRQGVVAQLSGEWVFTPRGLHAKGSSRSRPAKKLQSKPHRRQPRMLLESKPQSKSRSRRQRRRRSRPQKKAQIISWYVCSLIHKLLQLSAFLNRVSRERNRLMMSR